MFEKFRLACPVAGANESIDTQVLMDDIKVEFGVSIPEALILFWKEFGSGYFADKILYVFGDNSQQPRDSFIKWNKKDFWKSIYPSAKDGGPLFFAETCFGDQIGFRQEDGEFVFILFCVDTFDAYIISKNSEEFFSELLSDKYSLLDEERYKTVFKKLGELEMGMHYAPIVSPLFGGKGDAENFAFETPNVHFRSAVANFISLNS